MHPDRLTTGKIGQDRRQNVLSGMLLHVVETARPIHLPGGSPLWERVNHEVGDTTAFVHHIYDLDTPQATLVEWLTSGSGIKRCPIQVDPAAVVDTLHDGGSELGKVCVAMIEPIGHGNPMPQDGLNS
jgi:hypothetical protein